MAAAVGAAGLDGLQRAAVPPPPADLNMYDRADPAVARAVAGAKSLPKDLAGALAALDQSAPLRAGLGDDFVGSYLKLRREQWEEYAAQLTPWELRTYLDC